VSCWNALAGNVIHSINKGDEVIVRGLLTTETWEGENGRRSATRLKALSVGASLSRGWTTFHRVQRPAQPAGEPPAGPLDDQVPAAPFDEGGPDGALGSEDYIDDPVALSSVDPGQAVREPAYS
jgi:single-strand DNA-binding protein